MAFPTKEIERMKPNNISDSGLRDEDSGLRLFRGMMSPWDSIKSFKETYNFLIRHAALMSVGYMNALKIMIPDYETRQSTLSAIWATMMDYAWKPGTGQLEEFEDRFEVPPFMKDGVFRSAMYADKGDEHMLLPGHIWYCTNDRVEKEIHGCQFDIGGPDVCDLSLGGGSHFCYGIACQELNNMDPERLGCGDPYCVAIMETKKKYGKHPNTDKNDKFGPEGYEWEVWGPAAGGLREKGMPHKEECEFLNTGIFMAPTGATWTAGEMYKDCSGWPLAYSYIAVEALRSALPEELRPVATETVKVMFDTAGKFQFGEWNTRKEIREWMGVPADVDDGRVMGGYISMIIQARALEWSFLEFTPERVVIECERAKFCMMGMYPEYVTGYEAYFNGAVKTLVSTAWIVKAEEDVEKDKLRFIVEKAAYGFRRQKPNKDGYEKKEKD